MADETQAPGAALDAVREALSDDYVAGFNAALEWGASFIEGGYPRRGDTADPHALAMSLRAGRKPRRWDVTAHFIAVCSDGVEPCCYDATVEAIDDTTACEMVEAQLWANAEVTRMDEVRAVPASDPAVVLALRAEAARRADDAARLDFIEQRSCAVTVFDPPSGDAWAWEVASTGPDDEPPAYGCAGTLRGAIDEAIDAARQARAGATEGGHHA